MDIRNLTGSNPANVVRLSETSSSMQTLPTAGVQTKPSEEDGQAAKASRQAVEQAASSLEQSPQNVRRDLKFSVDDETGQMVVKVTDAGTGEVIRQMPSEEALKLAQRLDEARSLLFKAEA